MSERSASSEPMQFRAVVIGVDKYPEMPPNAQLSGCVNDAIAIRQFLMDHVNVPAENIRLLLSGNPIFRGAPASDPALMRAKEAHIGATLATSTNIRNAFHELLEEVKQGEEVIIFIASHGVRVSNPVTNEYVYGFAPADTTGTPSGFANLILGKELNQLTRKLTGRRANPTLIADTCHSASSVRAIVSSTVRRLPAPDGSAEWRLSGADWKQFVAAHPALGPEATFASRSAQTTRGSAGGSGWVDDEAGSGDWVMLAACRDTEVAGEYVWRRHTPKGIVSEPHGMLTGCLLVELQKVPDNVIRGLRWMNLHPQVQRAVRTLASQSPTLEGRPERTVFGGAWTPFQPGYSVQPTADGSIVSVAAGELHGLEEGAEIAIFRPDTANFAAAAAKGVEPAHALVETSMPTSCTAHLTSGGPVAANSRAIISKPSPKASRTRVLLSSAGERALSADTISAIKAASGAADFLAFVDTGPADVEVQPWKDDRWALVTYSDTRPSLHPDDVIAYVGRPGTVAVIDEEEVIGNAIGAGLVHWARYLRVRDRRNLAPSVESLVNVVLHAGKPGHPQKDACPPHVAKDGVYDVEQDMPLWVEVQVNRQPAFRLFVGVVACSDDGNVDAMWPPQGGDPTAGGKGLNEWDLPSGQSLWIGQDQHNPALPTVRKDQEHSMYTFKVFAVAQPSDAPPPHLQSLAIPSMVQDTVNAALGRGGLRGSIAGGKPSPVPVWYTVDLRVRIARRK